ncbi:class I SAM-dependent methyltransferase [Tellurirhabdus bombi]|uniref:class I SAM-dependent methyltransferase n=1 Tax=Tellurirhabdus bombi TaxID=2907205 RepID=UPI001F32D18B|nr:class I SAM-dependent methyltransferase [Tellurirhabdus bombi]
MTLERVTTCPVCGSTNFSDWTACQDNLVSGETFTIQQCNECKFKLTNPRPDAASIGRYYESDQYISHSDTKEGLLSRLYHSVRKITLQQKVDLINSLQPNKGRLLDIGCGSGYFVAASQKAGWEIAGMEPDTNARAQATQRTGKKIASSIDELAAEKPFDVITLWHVLEHVHDLPTTMSWLRDHSKKGSNLVIAVPNYLSWDSKQYNQQWAAYDVPRHLYHFAPDTLKKLLSKYGFQVNEQRPMLFDAFYVNLLSTKYRDGKSAYFESFWNGIRSNWDAYQNGGNYSSLIYVAQVK